MQKIKQPIDPKTTRRRVPFDKFQGNSGMFAQYRVIGYEGRNPSDTPQHVVLEKKPEFCH